MLICLDSQFTEQKILGDIVEGSGYYASVGIPLSSGVFSRVPLILLALTPLFNLT